MNQIKTEIVEVTYYITSDGKKFITLIAAQVHQQGLDNPIDKTYGWMDKFKVGDRVYMCKWNCIAQCVVKEMKEEVIEDECEGEFIKYVQVDLKDVIDGNEYTISSDAGPFQGKYQIAHEVCDLIKVASEI